MAWFRKPVGSAKPLEDRIGKPNIVQRFVLDIGEFKAGNFPCGLAWQDCPIGCDRQKDTPPPLQACLGELLKIIGQDMENLELSGKLFACCSNDLCSVFDLGTTGQQGCTITECPTRVLHMSQFDFVDFPIYCQVDDGFEVVKIMAVQYDVERDREFTFAGEFDCQALLFK